MKIRLAIFLLIAMTGLCSLPVLGQSYSQDKARADEALSRRDYGTAITAFQNLVGRYPEKVEAHNALGYSYYLNGQFNQAIYTFENALSRFPNNDSAKRNLILTGGRVALESSYKQGLDSIAKLKNRFPGHPQLAVLDFYSGKLHYLYGFSGPAFDSWTRVAAARPKSGTALFMKAVDARFRKDSTSQNRYFQEAIAKMPSEEVFRLWGARTLIEAGRMEEAAVLTTPISERNILTPGVAIALSRFERMRGRTLQAFEQLKKTQAVPEVLIERALMTSQMGASPQTTRQDLQTALNAGGEGATIILAQEPGARVYVDGTLLGSPPLGLFPSPGIHEIRVIYEPRPVLVSRFQVPTQGMMLVQLGKKTGIELKSAPSNSEHLP